VATTSTEISTIPTAPRHQPPGPSLATITATNTIQNSAYTTSSARSAVWTVRRRGDASVSVVSPAAA